VLIVDDLQWVDEVSVALIGYLVRSAEADALPMAVVSAGRPSATAGGFRDLLAASLPESSPPTELDLGPLNETAGIALVRSITPSASAADASRIWREAAGSPFWIEALATAGEALDDSLTRRFGQLGSDAAAILQALAVVARPTDVHELSSILDWSPPRVASGIAELRSRGLALEGPGTVQAAHDLIREAARRQVPRDAAQRLHARLARHLHAVAGGDVRVLRESLDHARAAEVDPLDIALDLVTAPQRRLIGAAGVTDLADVVAMADPGDPRRARLEERLAELATELGDRPLELERWLAVAERPEPSVRAAALLAASRAAYRMGMRETASALVARCRTVGVEDAALAIALDAHESEILRWLDHRLTRARRLTRRALAAAERALRSADDGGGPLSAQLRAACIEALRAASDLALQEGNERDQATFGERILALADGELERMEAELLVASAYRRSGRVTVAEEIARRVGAQATRRLYPAVAVSAGHHLARALYAQGRMEDAERVAAQTEQLSTRIGETGRFLSEIRALRPGISVSRGDWRAGIGRLLADIDREPDPHYQLGIQQEIATWLARLGGPSDHDEVRRKIAEARASLAAVGCPRCSRELALRSASALARIGDLDEAWRAIAAHANDGVRHSLEGSLSLREAIGSLRLGQGRHVRAARTLHRLSRRLAAAGLHREALWADIDRAAAVAHFDPAQAIGLLRSVAERAEAGGIRTDLQVARLRLRQLGARPAPPRPTAGPLGLSRRELEVARMAAAGASNPEIATALFLSRKTVERHVSAALAKSGARNRTELAARLASLSGAPGAPGGA
jgi:DNA-binding CsgD family transcriptional regulator